MVEGKVRPNKSWTREGTAKEKKHRRIREQDHQTRNQKHRRIGE
jgi:hypothetical protein